MDESDLDLDDLLAALQSVASSSEPDSDTDMDPNDDPNAGDFDPNDDPNNVDDPEDVDDDPRSYRDEDDDDDDEGDYSRSPSIVIRLQRLENEAGVFRMPRTTRPRPTKGPMSKADQNMNKVSALRQKTYQINFEMETCKLLAAETKEHKQASVALYLANLSPVEKREHDEDMNRIAHYYSGICPEASSSWREEARAEFRNKRLS
jgi:hypothetical protein